MVAKVQCQNCAKGVDRVHVCGDVDCFLEGLCIDCMSLSLETADPNVLDIWVRRGFIPERGDAPTIRLDIVGHC